MSDPEQTFDTNFEHEERWDAVDAYALSHLHTASDPHFKAINNAASLQTSSGLPDIAVPPLQGKFLALQCKLINAAHVLEIGTLSGYSTVWMATASPTIKITTIEVSTSHAAVARKAFEEAGVADRIELLVGPALEILPRLKEEVESGKRPRYDFGFIDADKPPNPVYLDYSVSMARKGACVIVDNVVRKGKLASDKIANEDEKVKGSREAVEMAGRDDRIDATLIQTVGEKNYDGFLMCFVK